MSAVSSSPTHPSIAAVAHAREAITAAGQRDPIFLSPAEHGALLSELVALTSQVPELKAFVTLAAGPAGVDDASGAHDVTAWIASALGVGHSQARAATRFAQRLDSAPSVAEAMRAGTMTVPQADVVTRALDALPTDLDPLVRLQAELHLVDLAADHTNNYGPRELGILGRKVLEVVAPDIAEAAEAAALERAEATAEEKTRLSLRFPGDGTMVFRGVVPELSGIRLANYLNALTNPRHHPHDHPHDDPQDVRDGATPTDDSGDADVWRRLPNIRKLGQALCELLDRIDPKTLPDHGGVNAELIVTMSLDALRTELATATVFGPEGATPISAAEARRLACTAGIIPAVLGTRGEVLDLGRTARLANRAQRTALMLAHPVCQVEHCDRPAPWCEAHHLDPWAHGGRTDLGDMALLCGRHHRQLHHHEHTHERLLDGTIRFTRHC